MGIQYHKYHIILSEYFSKKPLYVDNSACRDINIRKIVELPWQLSSSELWDKLAKYLSISQDLYILITQYKSDVKQYWNSIESFSEIRMINKYIEIIENPSHFKTFALEISDLFDETSYPDQAIELLTTLSHHYRETNDDEGLIASLSRLGIIHTDKGNLEKAFNAFRECETAIQRSGVLRAEAATIYNQARVLEKLGRIDQALAESKKAELLFQRDKEIYGYCNCLIFQAGILRTKGLFSEAVAILNDALKNAQLLNSKDLIVDISLNKASVFYAIGELQTVENFSIIAEQFFAKLGSLSKQADAHKLIGLVNKSRSDYKLALYHQKKAANFYQQLGYSNSFAQAIGNQAEILIKLSRFEKARLLNEESIEIFRRNENKVGLAVSLINQGIIYSAIGKPDKSEIAFQEAKRLSNELGYLQNLGHALVGIAILRKKNKDINEAKDYFDNAIETFRKSNTTEGLCATLLGRADLMFNELEDHMNALSDLEQVIDISLQKGFKSLLKQALSYVVDNFRQRDELPYALAAAKELCAITDKDGQADERCQAHLAHSSILIELGKFTIAGKEAKIAIEVSRQYNLHKILVNALLLRIICLHSVGMTIEALRLLEDGILISRKQDFWPELIKLLVVKAKILKNNALRQKDAIQCLKEAQARAENHNLQPVIIQVQKYFNLQN